MRDAKRGGVLGRITGWLMVERNSLFSLLLIVGVIYWVHGFSGSETFRAQSKEPQGWADFRSRMGVDEFGEDGYFVRAVRHGYALFTDTARYAPRFARRDPDAAAASCAACHTVGELAYAFVNSDREVTAIGRRVSFEEQVMRCYVKHLDGYVPTRYDPAVRDLRILARMMARHLNLSEGELRPG